MTSSMDFLREEIQNLKKLGQSWDMEKYQIEEAIMKAIADKNGNIPEDCDVRNETSSSKHGCFKTCFIFSCYIAVAIFCLGIAGAYLYNNYTPVEVYVNRVAGDLQYPVMRLWRLMLLPLHSYFNMQYFSVRECLVDNPWYISEEPDCEGCAEATEVPRLNNITNFHNDHVAWGNPIIVTDVYPYSAKDYRVEDFFKYYEMHRDKFDTDICEVSCVDESVATIQDYYKLLQKLGPDAPDIRWKLCYGKGLRTLRKFMPRPYFISTEGALEKFLMIVNTNTDEEKNALSLPTGQYPNAWVAQVTGSSEIELAPIPECNATCSDFNVTLNKGEVMYLNQEIWNFDIVGNPSDEPAIILLSTFA